MVAGQITVLIRNKTARAFQGRLAASPIADRETANRRARRSRSPSTTSSCHFGIDEGRQDVLREQRTAIFCKVATVHVELSRIGKETLLIDEDYFRVLDCQLANGLILLVQGGNDVFRFTP